MTDSSRKFHLSGFMPCQLATATHSIMRTVATVFEERFGISMPEWKVLAIIAESPGLSAVAVARRAQMDTVAVSRAVTKLMDRGRVARELDHEDRRRSILNLSEQGLDLYQRVAPVAKELEASLLEDFSDEERQVIEKVMRTLSAKAQEFSDEHTGAAQPGIAIPHGLNGHKSQNRYRPQQATPLVTYRMTGNSYSVR